MDDLRSDTQKQIDALTPAGWSQRFVPPPWPRAKSACRSCGTSGEAAGPWSTCVLSRQDPGSRTLLFTIAMCCSGCATDEAKLHALADRAFAALSSS